MRELVSLSRIIFDDNLETTSVSLFIAYFNLLSCEFDRFAFKLLYDLHLNCFNGQYF